ncbi:MAG: hypothetical protein JW788_06375 [Candidatus Omnitrophica bacterium]|nr:hypothetical protein [Candidatus Omnitrophota bacterium]
MNKKMFLAATALFILFFSANIALAADNASFQVSCTMPAIPGVNVPLVEKVEVRETGKLQNLETRQGRTPVVMQTFYCR